MLRPSRPTVLLFDIDGTLLLSGGAGRRAIDRAFAQAHQRPDATSHFHFGGMTDPAIIREGLRTIGVEATPSAIDEVLGLYLEYLADELPRSTQYQVMPGVERLLDQLRALPGLAVGLGTGNLKKGAFLKLARGKLDHHFNFGGFACDAEDRAVLVEAGAQRGRAQLGLAPTEGRVVVIGDTPKDVAAAQAIGALCVGVGTGGHSPEALRRCGAPFVFEDLSQEGVLEILLRGEV